MSNPYQILGVSTDADDAALRRRYLELVRQYPPEKSPQQFAEIRAAYEELRDPAARLEKQLFGSSTAETLDEIIAELRSQVRDRRIPTETLLSLGER
ncbi:MAG: J domain-containing protein [Thermoguttaceae bacterium]